MRFRFLQPNTPAMTRRLRHEAAFDQFWTTFRDRVTEVEQLVESRGPVAAFMHAALPLLDGSRAETLEWEIGPSPDGDWKLVFSTGGRRELRALCDRLVEMAPAIPGWSVFGHRRPEPPAVAPILAEGRRARPLPDARFRVNLLPSGRLDLECLAPVDDDPIDASWHGSAMLLMEVLVGEEDFDRWVGPIGLTQLRKRGLLRRREPPPADAINMGELRNRVLAEIARLRARLPDRPRWQLDEQGWADADAINAGARKVLVPGEPSPWSVADLTPSEPNADGDWHGWSDQFVVLTKDRPLLEGTRSAAFDSARHSRFGERFCYVKAERADFAETSDARGAVEERLDAVLRAAGAYATRTSTSGSSPTSNARSRCCDRRSARRPAHGCCSMTPITSTS